MEKQKIWRTLLAGTALTVAAAAPLYAQTVNVNVEELAGKSEECRSLGEFIAAQNGSIEGADQQQVANAVNNDVSEECTTIQATLEQAAQGGTQTTGNETTGTETTTETQDPATDSATTESATDAEATSESESEVTTETVDMAEEATITGEAIVRVPEPNVDVQVPQPEITVTKAQPQVSVQEGASRIEVQQSEPEISVDIPTINVRVTMPAPRIYVLQNDPQVTVAEADPQVEVVQGEPTVTVTQAEPELDIDLGLAQGEAAPEGENQQAQADSAQGSDTQNVSGNVEVTEARPVVNFVTSQEQPQVDITRAQPEVSFSSAEPNVTINLAQEPTVEVQMSGEPEVTIETAEEREQRQAQAGAAQGEAATAGQAPATTEGAAANVQAQPEAEQANAGAAQGQMTVGDLMGMDVVTADGENLGNPEAVIESEGEQYLLLSSGGFLDIGDKIVPVRMSSLTVNADQQIVLGEVTEADVERAESFEYDENAALEDDQPVMMGN